MDWVYLVFAVVFFAVAVLSVVAGVWIIADTVRDHEYFLALIGVAVVIIGVLAFAIALGMAGAVCV